MKGSNNSFTRIQIVFRLDDYYSKGKIICNGNVDLVILNIESFTVSLTDTHDSKM